MATNTFSSLAAHLRSHNIIPATPPPLLPQALLHSPRLAAALALAVSLSIPAVSYATKSYRGYLALGPGGMPHNVLGWAMQGALQLVARWDTRDPAPFSARRNREPYEPHGSRSFLGDGGGVPERRGGRPDVPGYVAPQRQATQQQPGGGEGDTCARMRAFLEALAARNPGLLAVRPSRLEGAGTPALWLDGRAGAGGDPVVVPPYMGAIKGELAHVHPEGSSHVTVSMADAGELVTKGWAERHRLSGVFGALPWSYVLVYAPRDEAEFEVWRAVVAAGVRFVCAGSGREVVVE